MNLVCFSPGRFFAGTELKLLLAYVLVNYDIKFERPGVRPANVHTAFSVRPDPDARILFRKRTTSLS